MKKTSISQILAELSWTKADFLKAGIEVPDRLVENDVHTEGELMTDDEIAKWVVDTEKTFLLVKEQDEKLFEKLYQGYVTDIHYLCEIGKISADEADEFLKL